jgi:hypothetical protein
MKETMSRIVSAYWERKCGGVILVLDDPYSIDPTGETKTEAKPKQYQMIEFVMGPTGPAKVNGIPMIKVRWARAPDEKSAKALFFRFVQVETISCSDETFSKFIDHMARYCRDGQRTNPLTGIPVFEGYLSPTGN